MWVDRLLLGRTGRWPERLDPSAGLWRACPARRAARVASALNRSVPSTNTAATTATARRNAGRGIAHGRDDAPGEPATAIRCGAALRTADPALIECDRRIFLSGPAQHTRRRRRAHLLVAHLEERSYAFLTPGRITYTTGMAVIKAAFPNLPGVFQSGPFRLRLNKFHGPQQISLIYKEKLIASFDPGVRRGLIKTLGLRKPRAHAP